MFTRLKSFLVLMGRSYLRLLGGQRSQQLSKNIYIFFWLFCTLSTKTPVPRSNKLKSKFQDPFESLLFRCGSFTYAQLSTISASRYWNSTIHTFCLAPRRGYLPVASLGGISYLDLIFLSCGFLCPFYGQKSCLVLMGLP